MDDYETTGQGNNNSNNTPLFTQDEQILNAALLNCLMYYDSFNFDFGDEQLTLGEAIDRNQTLGWHIDNMSEHMAPGFMTGDKEDVVLHQIENDEYLSGLRIVGMSYGEELDEYSGNDRDNENQGPVCIALEDPVNKQLYFVFRGTNNEEWMDNAEGFIQSDTRLQEHALEFFNSVMENYEGQGYEINLTGHSKGGNKAMYVAVNSEYEISSCINYDGQGFSPEFVAENEEKIRELYENGTITTICADQDYVSPLGIDIASSTRIYDTNQVGTDMLQALFGINIPFDNSFYENASNLATLSPFLNTLDAHSPGAIFHVVGDHVELNTEVSEREPVIQELSIISDALMNECTPEERAKASVAMMSLIQMGYSRDSYIIDNETIASYPEIAEGLDILKRIADEKDCQTMSVVLSGVEGINNTIQFFDETLPEAVNNAIDYGKEKAGEAVDYAKEQGNKAWNFLKQAGSNALDFIKNGAIKIGETAKEVGEKAKEYGSNIVHNVGEFFKNPMARWMVCPVVEQTRMSINLGQKAWDAISDKAEVVLDQAKDLGQIISDYASLDMENVKEATKNGLEQIENTAGKIKETVDGVLDDAIPDFDDFIGR